MLLILAALIAASPANSSEPPGIYGGTPVEPGAWPAVVAVQTDKGCTGILVAPDLVLTAAHCFDPSPANVVIGLGDEVVEATLIPAADWGAHPDFCLPSACPQGDLHDFAWVRLPEPLQIEPIVPITDQAEYDQAMVEGRAVVFVGFGLDESDVSGIKREVESTIGSFNESGREFRAGGGGKDTCSGDSGGPALVQLDSGEWRLAGVLSRGGECGSGGTYGVPLPELCWLRDESGVDLLPTGCGECDCVDIAPAGEDECACRSGGRTRGFDGWAWTMLPLALIGLRRRAMLRPFGG